MFLPLAMGLVPVPAVMLDPVPPSRQVIVVTAPRWGSTRAVLRRYTWTSGGWVRSGPVVDAWLGRNGLAAARKRQQNSGQTPAGVFALPQAFGTAPARGVRLPYHRVTPRSYWPYDPRDPRTYNVLQTRRWSGARWRDDGNWSERLIDYGMQYRRAVVIGYNLPSGVYRDGRSGERRARHPARISKGGGIFLHVAEGRPTAGCIAVSGAQMRRTLRWLDPAARPRIVVGPPSVTRGWRGKVT
ncbi:MAG: L,D-transpeptidase family protein [Candidatus Nanopelagicales bacterium]